MDVYTKTGAWPAILTIVQNWKTIGMGSILYYATLMGIDSGLFEAATIDGANRWKRIWYISIPGLMPVVTIRLILGIGDIFTGDFGLFYQIPRNVGMLYEVTDIIPTYTFRALQTGNFSAGSAVGLAQGVVGLIMILISNL